MPDSSLPIRTTPLRVMFIITSMPVGGAETLLVNLVKRFDPQRIEPLVCCLKQKDVLGEQIANQFPVFEHMIGGKFDLGVVPRLRRLFQLERIDVVVTVGAGDKMFWGRLAAKFARVPVVLSALHSTGWPDGVGKLNRMLTRITDGFIGVAKSHGEFLVEFERFPESKVFVIPNGIDTTRFQFDQVARNDWRNQLGIAEEWPVVGIVAALRPEKNHGLFLRASADVRKRLPNAQFLIVGDGPERSKLESLASELNIEDAVHFVGSVSDIPGVLSAIDLFALSSHNEASPVSILEAMACQRPVVATDVGSIKESVLEGETGYLVEAGAREPMVDRWTKVLTDREQSQTMGRIARQHVCDNSSLDSMTNGYTELAESIYSAKTGVQIERRKTGNPVQTNVGSSYVSSSIDQVCS